MHESEPLRWKIHLAARQPGRAIIAVLIIVLALSASAAFHAHLLLLLLAAFLLVSAIAEFLFPISYTLDADGAHARVFGSHRVLPWKNVRRVYLSATNIKLSPLPHGGWMEQYRGVTLRMTNREMVWDNIRVWLAAAGVKPEIIEER